MTSNRPATRSGTGSPTRASSVPFIRRRSSWRQRSRTSRSVPPTSSPSSSRLCERPVNPRAGTRRRPADDRPLPGRELGGRPPMRSDGRAQGPLQHLARRATAQAIGARSISFSRRRHRVPMWRVRKGAARALRSHAREDPPVASPHAEDGLLRARPRVADAYRRSAPVPGARRVANSLGPNGAPHGERRVSDHQRLGKFFRH